MRANTVQFKVPTLSLIASSSSSKMLAASAKGGRLRLAALLGAPCCLTLAPQARPEPVGWHRRRTPSRTAQAPAPRVARGADCSGAAAEQRVPRHHHAAGAPRESRAARDAAVTPARAAPFAPPLLRGGVRATVSALTGRGRAHCRERRYERRRGQQKQPSATPVPRRSLRGARRRGVWGQRGPEQKC